MVHIKNRSDLKMAYEILMDIQALKPLPGREGAVQEHIRKLKKDIRDYFKQQEKDNGRHIICDDGINGYTELIKLPECLHTKDSAETYFENKEVLRCPDLPGGCTGHPFTCWHRSSAGKIGCGHTIVYHMMCKSIQDEEVKFH